jgi:hypothetical protein
LRDEFFEERVFPTEMVEIRARRNVEGLTASGLAERPTPENDLLGLSISGGGVRSASIALGVVQALSEAGVLRRVDYLSTVSGGGFLGSCISALLHRPFGGTSAEDFPLNHHPGSAEPPALAHVRSFCAYLTPEGFVDRIRIPALLVRGILINVFTALPFLLLAVGITDVFYGNVRNYAWLVPSLIFLGLFFFTTISLIYPVIGRILRRNLRWSRRNLFTQMLGVSFFGALALLASMPLLALISVSILTSWNRLVYDLSTELTMLVEDFRDPVLWMVLGASLIVLVTLLKTIRPFRELLSRAAVYPVGLIGPAMIFSAYLLLCVAVINEPFVDGVFRESLRQHVFHPNLRVELQARGIEVGVQPTVTPLANGRWKITGIPDDVVLESESMMGSHYLFLESASLDHSAHYFWGGLVVLMLLIVLVFYDVNVTSLHGFYRDRLSRAWLITMTSGKSTPQHVDHLRLSQMREPGSRAPYHLILAAVNSSEMEPRLHGRAADFFLFSKHWIGGQLTGWCSTGVMEKRDPMLDLGTAMAISGAAAAPQMGDATIRPLALLLALLNVRMAYWLPNPGRAREANWLTRLRMWRGAGPQYLLAEAMGSTSLKQSHILVSDGGHIENLGVYALLKRRCRVIIAVDGEQDQGRHCPSLLRVIRYARVDMGIHIDIDLSPIALDEEGFSARCWAAGTIHYGGGETGTLIYMKSTLTGSESVEIQDFHRRFPSFPHDSTADQFFDPERFEMYRLLGHQLARRAVEESREDERMAPVYADMVARVETV